MRALRISLIVLVVLGVLFTAADRLSVSWAENEVASRAQTSLGLSETPDVSIKGFPFLTQIAGKNLSRVDVGVSSYPAQVDGTAVTVEQLDIELRDLKLGSNFSTATARHADGTGLITYEELSRAYGELLGSESTGLGVSFGPAEDGRLLITLQASVMGQRINVGDVPGDITLEGDRVRVEVDTEALTGIPDSVLPQVETLIQEQAGVERTIFGLPNGLALSSVTPGPEGLELTVTGSDLSLVG
ncbi:LmeA family phospholipid-binding protein [Streptomyces xiamenensis]|uniref:LmeA family phospholipid-binding protein n=1 Tax=Streptomyces xiamenensis TaxID=408015 RepID=UPI003D7227CD